MWLFHTLKLQSVLPVELPLIESQLGQIDEQLKGAEESLDWSGDVLEYINVTYEMIKDLEQRLQNVCCIVD